MALETSANAFGSPAFKGKVRAAMIQTSKDIFAEPVNTSNHALRQILARRVMQDPDTAIQTFLGLASVDPQIAGAVDPLGVADEVIQASVSSLWTQVASNMVI